MDSKTVKFAERLKLARSAAGLTQLALADYLDSNQPTIAKWESGKSFPRVKTLKLLAEILKTSVEWLVGEAPVDLPDSQQPKDFEEIFEKRFRELESQMSEFLSPVKPYGAKDRDVGRLQSEITILKNEVRRLENELKKAKDELKHSDPFIYRALQEMEPTIRGAILCYISKDERFLKRGKRESFGRLQDDIDRFRDKLASSS